MLHSTAHPDPGAHTTPDRDRTPCDEAPAPDDAEFRQRVARYERVAITAFALLYAGFIFRSSSVIDGRRTFTLFDDAMISMRYGRNLTRGEGLVYNVGEHVEGYTNLAWTLVMSVVHLVVRDPRLTALAVSVIGAGILIGQLLLVRAILRRTTDAPWAPLLGIAAVGANFALVFWTLRGMEVGLLSLILVGAIAVLHLTPEWSERRRAGALLALLALGVFTRDDALVLAVVIGACYVATRPRALRWRTALGATLALGTVVVLRWSLRWWMYGETMPNTYVLKVAGASRTLLVERGAAAVGYVLMYGLVVALVLAWCAWRSGPLARTCLAAVVGQALYSVGVGGDAWEAFGFANRFVATVVAPLMIAAVLGLVALHRGETPDRLRRLVFGALTLSAAAMLVLPQRGDFFQIGSGAWGEVPVRLASLLLVLAGLARVRTTLGLRVVAAGLVLAGNLVPAISWLAPHPSPTPIDNEWAAYGLALQDATEPGATIAASGIGNLGYFADRPIIDLLGKVDPAISHEAPRLDRWMLPGHTKWDYRISVGDQHPDVVAQLFAPTRGDLEYLESIGYRRVGFLVFVSPDAPIVSDRLLERAVERSEQAE